MSIRGTVTFECDHKGCHAEEVVSLNNRDADLDKDGMGVTAYVNWWRMDEDGALVCPFCADENPREKGEDDGREYGHPREAQEDRLR